MASEYIGYGNSATRPLVVPIRGLWTFPIFHVHRPSRPPSERLRRQGATTATQDVDLWFESVEDPRIGEAARTAGGAWIAVG